MSEQTDKPLHDWVRQSLDTYRPDYNPTDWVALQRTLRRRRWMRRGAWGGAGLLLLGLFSWFVAQHQADKVVFTPTVNSKTGPIDSVDVNKSVASKPLVARVEVSKRLQVVPKLNQVRSVQRDEPILPPASLPIISDLTLLPTRLTEDIQQPHVVAFSPEETAITQQLLTGDFGADSTSYRALARNLRSWPDAVIVCDLTTSMYPYTTQLFAWFRKNAGNQAIKGMVFFTDCDSLGQQTRLGGPAGRMFITRERDPANALPILLDAARNTVHNVDDAENDVEALLAAQQAFPEVKNLILLADNISTVKDIRLVNKVKKPVHVVLCGTTGSDTTRAFQPDYYTIASYTQGSLHTLEDDLLPNRLSKTTTLRVGSNYYRYIARRKQFKRTPFDHRPRHFLGLLWL